MPVECMYTSLTHAGVSSGKNVLFLSNQTRVKTSKRSLTEGGERKFDWRKKEKA